MTPLLLLVPLILVVVFIALVAANRAIYEIASRNGYYCATSPGLAGSTVEKIGPAQTLFSINNFVGRLGLSSLRVSVIELF